MTEDEFLAAWKLVYGYGVVDYEEARDFKFKFKSVMPTRQYVGLLSKLRSEGKLVAHGNKWRLAHETSKVVAG